MLLFYQLAEKFDITEITLGGTIPTFQNKITHGGTIPTFQNKITLGRIIPIFQNKNTLGRIIPTFQNKKYDQKHQQNFLFSESQ